MIRLLLGLEVVEEDRALLRLLTPVLDNDARAVDNLTGISLTVKNALVDISTRVTHVIDWKIVENIQRPAHSPSCFPSGTLIRGILCSEQRAITSFL